MNYCYIGLRFEILKSGIIVEEDVGTVDLCVLYDGGDNLPSTIDAVFYPNYHSMYNRNIIPMNILMTVFII